MMSPLHPSIHNVLRIVKISLTFLSILMACVCVVIIRRTRSNISKEYARLLIMLIVVTTQQDIYTQLIFDPQYIFTPDMCIFRDNPLINISLNAAWAFLIWVTLVAAHPPAYAACFLFRHQVLVPAESLFKLPRYGTLACVIIIAIPFLTFGFPYYISWVPVNDEIKQDISSEWDDSSITRMECFSQKNYETLRNGWACVLFVACIIFCLFISLHTLSVIRKATNLSTKTRSFHRTMLFSLIVVAGVPISLVVVPLGVAMPYYTMVQSNQLPVMEVGTFLFAFHSVVHSLVLILTTPVFRKRIVEMVQRQSVSAVVVKSAPS